jgi:ABC-type transporter Mla MlaB component
MTSSNDDGNSARGSRNGAWRRLFLFATKPHLQWGDTQINLTSEQERELREQYEREKARSRTDSSRDRELQNLRGNLGRHLESVRQEAESEAVITSPQLHLPKKAEQAAAAGGEFVETDPNAGVRTQPSPEYMETDPGFEVKPLDADAMGRIVGDASFMFSEGDDVAAESLLLRGVQEYPQQSKELYLFLLDMYHATGQKKQFESTAELYALTFRQPRPRWNDMTAGAPSVRTLNRFAMQGTMREKMALELFSHIEAKVHAQKDITLDFAGLRAITHDALEPLARSIEMLNEYLADVYLTGTERLRRVLADAVNDFRAEPVYWRARLAVERLRDDMNGFIALAREASLSAEVEGQTWEHPKCQVKAPTDLGEGFTLVNMDAPMATATFAPPALRDEGYVNAIALGGQMKGDEVDKLLKTRATSLAGIDQVVIDCLNLKRLDFEGAVQLLNWASQWESEGKTVKIVRVNRLVSGLLHRLGLPDNTTLVLHTEY